MIAVVRCAQSRIFICMCHPVEFAAVYDCSAECGSVSVHVLCGRVCDNICAPLNWSAVYRCREGIVHYKRYSVIVCHLCKKLYIKHRKRRIGNSLTKHKLCVWSECCIQLLLCSIRRYECSCNTHLCHSYRDEVEGASIDG